MKLLLITLLVVALLFLVGLSVDLPTNFVYIKP